MVAPELLENPEQGAILVLMEWRDEPDTEDPQATLGPPERLEPEVNPEHPELMDTPVGMEHPEHPDTVETPVTLVTLELPLTGMETPDLLDPLDPLDLPVMLLPDLPDPPEGLDLRDPQEMLVPLVSPVRRESVVLTDLTEYGLEEAPAAAERVLPEKWDPQGLP